MIRDIILAYFLEHFILCLISVFNFTGLKMWEFSVWCVGGCESSVRKKVCNKHLWIHCAPFCWQAKMNGLCSKFPMRHLFVAYSNFLSVRLYKVCSGWNLAPGIDSFLSETWDGLKSYRVIGKEKEGREGSQTKQKKYLPLFHICSAFLSKSSFLKACQL